jgi:hypothetical protein
LEIVQSNFGIVSALYLGGHLRHLKALKKISLCLPAVDSTSDVEWPDIDATLAQASDILAEVHLVRSAAVKWLDLALDVYYPRWQQKSSSKIMSPEM